MTHTFDSYADNYEESLNRGISLSGESMHYFAHERVAHVRNIVSTFRTDVKFVLDYGCGTGSGIPHLKNAYPDASIFGVDLSYASINKAKELYQMPGVHFHTIMRFPDSLKFDLVFCNGVFHHIPPDKRSAALAWIRSIMGKSGYFSLWENNPLNPGTKLVMRRIPFDRDAVTISPSSCSRMLHGEGFEILNRSSHFFFPKCLKMFRPLEPLLSPTMLGAQYCLVSRLKTG